jgi:hypothetical protein
MRRGALAWLTWLFGAAVGAVAWGSLTGGVLAGCPCDRLRAGELRDDLRSAASMDGRMPSVLRADSPSRRRVEWPLPRPE